MNSNPSNGAGPSNPPKNKDQSVPVDQPMQMRIANRQIIRDTPPEPARLRRLMPDGEWVPWQTDPKARVAREVSTNQPPPPAEAQATAKATAKVTAKVTATAKATTEPRTEIVVRQERGCNAALGEPIRVTVTRMSSPGTPPTDPKARVAREVSTNQPPPPAEAKATAKVTATAKATTEPRTEFLVRQERDYNALGKPMKVTITRMSSPGTPPTDPKAQVAREVSTNQPPPPAEAQATAKATAKVTAKATTEPRTEFLVRQERDYNALGKPMKVTITRMSSPGTPPTDPKAQVAREVSTNQPPPPAEAQATAKATAKVTAKATTEPRTEILVRQERDYNALGKPMRVTITRMSSPGTPPTDV